MKKNYTLVPETLPSNDIGKFSGEAAQVLT